MIIALQHNNEFDDKKQKISENFEKLDFSNLPKRFGSARPLLRFGHRSFGRVLRPKHRTEASFGR